MVPILRKGKEGDWELLTDQLDIGMWEDTSVVPKIIKRQLPVSVVSIICGPRKTL